MIRLTAPLQRWQHLPGRALLALASVAITTFPLVSLRDRLSTPIVALLFLLPVGLSSTFGGLTGGVLASVGAFIAFNYFFIQPYYSFLVHQSQDLVALVVFLGVGVFVSQLVGRARASQERAEAREREAVALAGLSTSLAALSAEDQIAWETGERLLDATGARAIEIHLDAGPTLVRLPATITWPPAGEPLTVLLPGGGAGQLRLWAQPSEPVHRMLDAFSGQCTLALERARLTRAENRSRVLEESDRLKSALLSSVSHELRTPLAAIQAAVTSLNSGEIRWEGPARADLLGMVEEEVIHLNRLVGNLLDMSRIEAGELRPRRQWHMLAEVVEDTLARLRRMTESHQVAVEVSEDLPWVPIDALQIGQVLANLMHNSTKYAPPGTRITVSAAAEDRHTLHCQVINQGPHVPEADLERIFDKFQRVTAADRVTGTGLGLSICKGIITAHGGRIWAENQPSGLAFHFTLPLDWEGAAQPHLPGPGDTA